MVKSSYYHDSWLFFKQSELGEDEIQPFEFYKEKKFSLFIDTFYNKPLRARFKNIGRIEKETEQLEFDSRCNYPHLSYSTPIIIMNTLDKQHINSMDREFGSSTTLCAIPDPRYEMWYFYKHS